MYSYARAFDFLFFCVCAQNNLKTRSHILHIIRWKRHASRGNVDGVDDVITSQKRFGVPVVIDVDVDESSSSSLFCSSSEDAKSCYDETKGRQSRERVVRKRRHTDAAVLFLHVVERPEQLRAVTRGRCRGIGDWFSRFSLQRRRRIRPLFGV